MRILTACGAGFQPAVSPASCRRRQDRAGWKPAVRRAGCPRYLALALAFLASSCSLPRAPWANEPIGNELNLAFRLRQNLIELQTVTIDGRTGRFILGSAAPRTIVDPRFDPSARLVQLSEKETLRLTTAPVPLGGVADAIIGADAWRQRAITIDYRVGLVSWQRDGIKPDYMTVYRFDAEPMINLVADGRRISAIVDTSLPDTLVLPAKEKARGTVRVHIADVDFGDIDVQYANVAAPRIGNRLLSRFLVTIDYGRRLVGLWQDPRMRQ
ncbi:MAG TPA: hypothetical protein VNA69_17930 [Thermoanaerobaculia bacterium]|nr:hypothetical protein [Thermoanaerobaculia bacterium]